MKEKSAILILALVLLTPIVGIAYPLPTGQVTDQNGTVESITYLPSENHTESLGITTSLGGAVLVKNFFDNITLETPFTDDDLSHVSLLVFSFVGGTWNWNYWSKPFWNAPLGASMKVVFQGISDAEVSDYIQKAKSLSLTFAQMYGLDRTVIYLLEYHGGTLIVGLYAQCDVNSVLDLWAESLPPSGLGELFNATVVGDSPFKYLGISLREPQEGATLGSVCAIYVRTGGILEEDGNYTLSVNNIVGHTGPITPSEGAEESFIYLNFPYLANITEVDPEPTFPEFEDWEEWLSESCKYEPIYACKSEIEPMLRRATYGLCGLLVWDMKNITSAEDITVSYNFNFVIEKLTHRPMILATTILQPARPSLGDEVTLTITLENVGNATAKHILVRPLVFPWLFSRIFEEIYDRVENWGSIQNCWVTKEFLSDLISNVYRAIRYISELKPGKSYILNVTLNLPEIFFSRIKAFYLPMGCHVLYGDEYHRRYMVTSNGYFTGIDIESPALISTLTLDKYLVKADENVNLTLTIKNLGDAEVNDVEVYIFSVPMLKANLAAMFMAQNQASAYLNAYELRVRATWRRFHQLEVYHETVESIGAGEIYNITLEKKIPWLGGSTALVAALTFPYDWESYTDETVWNRIPSYYQDRLPRRLLLLSNSINLYLVPGVVGTVEYQQPKLEVSKYFSTDDLSPGTDVDVTISVTNVGEMPANITVRDLKPTGCDIVQGSITASGGTTFTATIGRPRFRVTVIGVRNLQVNPGETVYLNYTLRITGDISGLDPPVGESSSNDVIIGPAMVTYSSDQPTIDPGTVESSEVLVAGETTSVESGFSLVSYTPGGPSLPRSLIFMGVIGLITAAAILILSKRVL